MNDYFIFQTESDIHEALTHYGESVDPVPEPLPLMNAANSFAKYLCVYCGYGSRWGVKDIKCHIFTTHMKKYPYLCRYCNYGSRHQHIVKKHMSQVHPKKNKVVRFPMMGYEGAFVTKLINNVLHIAVEDEDLTGDRIDRFGHCQGPRSKNYKKLSTGPPRPPPLKPAPNLPKLQAAPTKFPETDVDSSARNKELDGYGMDEDDNYMDDTLDDTLDDSGAVEDHNENMELIDEQLEGK